MAVARSPEDVISSPVLVFLRGEALRLEVEHGPVAPAERHQVVMGPELDDTAALEHADAIGMTHRREPMGDENRGAGEWP